ncbi:hypothetical protein QYE76_018228 [Lolium multiflorum]|uniref:Uncharacterized protein n=1 Tax=Lolium multiflorum TaxID=4521 RepID=A0AAD8QI87_LOLMU|nr:hypothetical protein QYE76_018228 [Lolium multiflorum]
MRPPPPIPNRLARLRHLGTSPPRPPNPRPLPNAPAVSLQVDAFPAEPFKGNPVAVYLLEEEGIAAIVLRGQVGGCSPFRRVQPLGDRLLIRDSFRAARGSTSDDQPTRACDVGLHALPLQGWSCRAWHGGFHDKVVYIVFWRPIGTESMETGDHAAGLVDNNEMRRKRWTWRLGMRRKNKLVKIRKN